MHQGHTVTKKSTRNHTCGGCLFSTMTPWPTSAYLIPAPPHNHPTCAAPYWQCWTIARYLECRVSVWYLRYAVDDGSTHTPKQMTMTKAKTTALRHRSTVPMATGLRLASTLPHAVDRGWMLLTMTLVLTSKKSTLQYSAEKSCGVGGLSREVSWHGCMVLVLRWWAVSGICTLRYSPEHPGCGVLLGVRCMRVRLVPIPPARVSLFYLQTRWRPVILIGHSTILRRLVKWLLWLL